MAKQKNTLVERLTAHCVAEWLPESIAELGRLDVERGRVARPVIRASRIHAVVADARRGRVRVEIVWDLDGPVSACECGSRRRGPCRHAAALALLVTGMALPATARPRDGGEIADPAAFERQVRRERGASELFLVMAPASGEVYGTYEVSSPSSRRYQVTIRALDAAHNGCTCPDFETNTLGTCKHIEAVLAKLRSEDPESCEKALRAGSPRSYLHLRTGVMPEVGIRLRIGAPECERQVRARFFSAEGRLKADLAEVWDDLERAALAADIEVPAEVSRLAARALESRERHRRQGEIEAEIFRAGPQQPGFHARLYPYQVEGVAFLASRGRAILADDMGLGKTIQAIAAMGYLMRTRRARRTLVVCPASLKHQWEREIQRFAGMGSPRVAVVGGPRAERRATYRQGPDVLITSYELARTDIADLELFGADLLILDEAQRIKNWRIQTSAAIKRLRSRYAFVLTGTPVENRLDDLYSLMQVVDPHILGPLWRFNQDFASLDDRGRPVGYRNLDKLRDRLAPVLLRRRKEEVLTQLPPQVINRLEVPMTPEQRAIHDEGEQALVALLGILKKRPLTPNEEQRMMRAFQRMRMACDAAGLVDKDAAGAIGAPKLQELASLLDEICVSGGRKVVVFSEWERMQAMAAEVCKKLGIGHVCLNGSVPASARGALIDRFRTDPRCQVFLSTDAGGVGLNLQVASHVINLDLPWNPAILAQRIARVHRIGQADSVNVVLLISQDSFEERLQATLGAKLALASAVVGDDRETTELERSTQSGRIATLLSETFAATTGPTPDEAALETTVGVDAMLTHIRTSLGADVAKLLRLTDGRMVGVVPMAQEVRRLALPSGQEVLLLPALAEEALAALGGASPLDGAEVVHVTRPDEVQLAARRDLLSAAERKVAAGLALCSAGMPGEALGLFHQAMSLACRALDDRGDPGSEPADILGAVYGHLLPAGIVDAAGAHALARAGELARAFGTGGARPPESLVTAVVDDARELVSCARARLGGPSAEGQGAADPTFPEPALSCTVAVGKTRAPLA